MILNRAKNTAFEAQDGLIGPSFHKKTIYLYQLATPETIHKMTDIQLKQLKDNLWHSADLLRQGAHLLTHMTRILSILFNRFMDMSVQGYGWVA